MSNPVRTEHDSIGEIDIPGKALWGAQTQRALSNFSIGIELIPLEIIYSLAKIKAASAIVNERLGVLDKKRSSLIINAAKEISVGLHDQEFPLKIWQSGSGTQTNMNVNEVISNLACKASGQDLGTHNPVHPNDHVNRSQSTNDTFPTAIHMATINKSFQDLLPELKNLINVLKAKENKWKDIIKVGRTHMQDAVPITLGQEVSAWTTQITESYRRIEESINELYQLPLGGTAIGTGINAPNHFDKEVVKELTKLTKYPFKVAKNKFALMSNHDGLINTMSQLKILAVNLLKIVNDIKILSCGPRAGLAELQLPENEPGSSIMPGKVNPTQCEAMSMVCTQVIGFEMALSISCSNGHLQMNSYKPLIAFNILKSIDLLYTACKSCRLNMLEGIEPNSKKIKENLDQSLMLITALTPKIGYEKSCKIAQLAYKENINLRDASNKLGYINEKEFEKILHPNKMV